MDTYLSKLIDSRQWTRLLDRLAVAAMRQLGTACLRCHFRDLGLLASVRHTDATNLQGRPSQPTILCWCGSSPFPPTYAGAARLSINGSSFGHAPSRDKSSSAFGALRSRGHAGVEPPNCEFPDNGQCHLNNVKCRQTTCQSASRSYACGLALCAQVTSLRTQVKYTQAGIVRFVRAIGLRPPK